MQILDTLNAKRLLGARLSPWLWFVAVLFLSGCESVWLDPYIDLPDRDLAKTYGQTGTFPQLLDAASATETLRQKANSNREQLVVGRSILSYGAFGAAAAGGIAALYGASTDLVLGFGVGAATAYGAGTLFTSTDRIDTYSAANRALNCVVGSADATMATAKSLDQLTTSGAYHINKTSLRNHITSFIWSQDLLDAALLAEREYQTALDNVNTFKALDPTFAVAVTDTTDTIVFAMEERIRATQPDLATVLKVAQGIGVAGVAYVKDVTPPAATPPPAGLLKTPSPADTAMLVSLTTRVSEAATRINEMATSATNRMDQLGSNCILNLPPIAPLTISQTEVVLSQDQIVTLNSAGGKLPLTYTWQGTTPSADQIEVILSSGKEIVLVGKAGLAGLPAGTEYDLAIRDSLAAPNEVLIKVKTP